jgi:hypothetical protein
MKIKCPENLRMEMTKQGEIQALQSLIFEYPPTQNRNFNLSIFVPNVFQMAPKDIRNRGPWVPLAQKVVEERFTKHVKKQASEKYEHLSKMYPKKVPGNEIFLLFFGV